MKPPWYRIFTLSLLDPDFDRDDTPLTLTMSDVVASRSGDSYGAFQRRHEVASESARANIRRAVRRRYGIADK